ncbi:OmpH family outer membrane protein [Roseivivax sp. THAF30]|uniref:OmpH family outer membrane protein n=1 Tax=Roseivivax sp. THAF30 TaxID=2587852 RepID=UPI001267914B|nr:OmpH family outer membrane protein [Roseivivax sp. THAF30]QFT62912.1 Outer membrane protein (OmpH-like) [Roseivivax sp. THAF30]
MIRLWAIWLGSAIFALVLALPVLAQDQGSGERAVVRSPILTIESERFFGESAFGQRLLSQIEEDGQALAAENRRLEAELTAEERRLTELRGTVEPEAFREMADDFDTRVQDLRQQQDAKARALANRDETARRQFFSAAQPVLGEILRDAGAALILERGNVLLSANSIDITDVAIARVDATIGDGSDLGSSAPEGTPTEQAPQPQADDGSLFDMGEGAPNATE